MTDREAIEALKLINLSRVHPFYDWEEMIEVRDSAISALQERIDRENVVQKPVTNADRIRAMSDEELAQWMSECNAYGEYGTAEQWLPWLRQPAKED